MNAPDLGPNTNVGRGLVALLATFFFLVPNELFASQTCASVLGHARAQIVNLNGYKGLLLEQDYRSTLASVNDLTGALIVPNVKVQLAESGRIAFADNANEVIHLSHHYEKYPSGKSAHPKLLLAILSHEYGHLIFERNMNANVENYREWAALSIRLGEVYEALLNEYLNRYNETDHQGGRLEQLSTRLNNARKNWEPYAHMRNVQFSYHEFFADAVAVVKFKDPRIIFDSLPIFYGGKGYRAFDKLWGPKAWKDFESDLAPDLQTKMSEFFPTHHLFSPARAKFWDLVRYKVRNPEQQKKILTDLFFVLKEHYDSNFQKLTDAENFNLIELNRTLITLLEEKFG